MELTILLFGPAREAAGGARARVELEPPATAGRALEALTAARPELAPLVERARVAVNRAYVDPGHPVGSDDEIALIPPVGGG